LKLSKTGRQLLEKEYKVHVKLKISSKNEKHYDGGWWWFMVLNITFNNISVISWQSVLLVEETGVPEENHRPVTSH